MSAELDQRVRLAAFQWLRAQVDVHGDVLPRSILAEGFVLDGVRVPLLGPQGIFKPALMTEAPLSITTIPGGPYDDTMGTGGALKYRYRGSDPAHPDNRGLRRAMQQQLPLVWFYRVQPGQYLVSMPVFVVGDHPAELSFDVAVDDPLTLARSSIVKAGGFLIPRPRDDGCGEGREVGEVRRATNRGEGRHGQPESSPRVRSAFTSRAGVPVRRLTRPLTTARALGCHRADHPPAVGDEAAAARGRIATRS